ncbi:MAG: hypothetical protein ACE5H3_03770 [Planctomycetota bacterium]
MLGGGPGGQGFSRLLPEDDDGTVEASSARLPGVREIRFAGVRHSCLPFHPGVRRVVTAFLARDGFRRERSPGAVSSPKGYP